jgi:hypothetical protein
MIQVSSRKQARESRLKATEGATKSVADKATPHKAPNVPG